MKDVRLQMKPQSQSNSRPLGVAIIAVVALLGGILGLLGGAVALSGAVANEPLLLGVVVIVFGVLGILLGIGFWTGIGWAWMLGVGVYVLSIPLDIWEVLMGGAGLIGGAVRVIVGLIILSYLTRPHVKAFFGKTGIPSTP